MSTVLTDAPSAHPPSAGMDQPPSAPHPSRWRSWAVLALLAAWLVAYQLLKGRWTLAVDTQDLTALHDWFNDLRDSMDVGKVQGGGLFRALGGLTDGLNWLVEKVQYLFSQPSPGRRVPIIGWLGVVGIGAWLAAVFAGWRMAVGTAASLLLVGFLGYWTDSVDTLIIVGVSVLICVVIGLPLGIWMARNRRVEAVVTPVLDVMQTMPSFAYLAPLALFFGIGSASAVVLTLIYALPPLVRISCHGLKSVSPTTVEATTAIGSTPNQLLRHVQLPMARRTIIVGLNQTILAALSMATIAAFVSGPGLGQPVIQALSSLNLGVAFVSGLCIVIVAIWLDRLTTAASERSEVQARRAVAPSSRRLVLVGGGVLAAVTVYASNQYLRYAEFPSSPDLGTPVGDWTTSAADWVVNTFGSVTTAFQNFVANQLLNPLQNVMAESPWYVSALALMALATLLGGWRALVATAICLGIILAVGVWNAAMVTLATTLVAAVLMMLIGVVVGVWMGRSRRADVAIRPLLDGLQTMPSLVYLIPTLALFGSGRVTAIVAAVAYAAPVSIKIMADGIRNVPSTTVEAAEAAGTNRWQMIGKVQLPMARGATMLAANQGLLFVLAVVVVGGLVGGGGLGFLVVSGFSQGELFGKGLAAGIAITALGVMLDRVTRYSAQRTERVEA